MEMSFGDWLKLRRRQIDLTQKELAYEIGCGLGTLRKLENGSRRPSKELAARIGEVLQVAEEELPDFVQFARSDPDPIQLPSFALEQISPPQVEIPIPGSSYLSSPPHNLPFSLTRIIGRDGEVAELTHLLLRSPQRLITLVGVGGIGKTRLATAVARAILAVTENPFPDGIFFVSLAALTNAEHLVPAIAQDLDFQFSPGSRSPQQQLFDYLQPKKLLLVMDNFEQLKEGFQILLEMLQAAADIKILVTSRESLGIQGEQNYLLRGLSYPSEVSDSDILTEYGAPALFIERAVNLRPGFYVGETEVPDLLHFCRMVDGMPLALIMAARWVEVLTLAEIVTEVKRSFDLLEISMPDLPTRHQSMRAVFDSTWSFLSERERQIYMALSIFRDGFTLEAAREVAGATPHNLKQLIGHALLARGEDGRFHLHELLRQFAEQELGRNPREDAAFRQHHSTYFCKFLAVREPNLKNARAIQTEAEIGRDYDNIRAAWKWASENLQESLLSQAAPGLGAYYLRRSESQEGVAVFRPACEAITATETISFRTRALLLSWLGMMLSITNQSDKMQEGVKFVHQALVYLDQAAEMDQEVQTLRPLALMALGSSTAGKLREGTEDLEASLALYSKLGMKWEMAFIHQRLTGKYNRLNEHGRVHQSGLEAQRLYEDVGDKARSNEIKLNIGLILWLFYSRFEDGEATIRDALAWFEENGPRQSFNSARNRLMDFFIYAGRYNEALSWHETGLLNPELRIYYGMELLNNAALLHSGHYKKVQDEASIWAESSRHIESISGDGYYNLHLGFVAVIQNQVEKAVNYLSKARETIRKSEGKGWAWSGLGYAALLSGDTTAARDNLVEALKIATNHKLVWTALFAFPLASLMLAESGEIERAIELYALACTYDFVANSRLFYDLTGQKVEALASTISSEIVTAAQERGRSLDFWDTAGTLLQEPSPQ